MHTYAFKFIIILFFSQQTWCNDIQPASPPVEEISFQVTPPVVPFVGRHIELSSIKWMHYNQRSVVIIGPLGVGKTELARKYIQQYRDEFRKSNVIWINCNTMSDIISDFQQLAYKLRIVSSDKKISNIITDVFNYFKKTKTMFVFDDITEYYTFIQHLNYYTHESNNVDILITSRDYKWFNKEANVVVKLEKFKKHEAVEFIQQSLSYLDIPLDNDLCEKVASIVYYKPLFLAQAVRYIIKHNVIYSNKYTLRDFIFTYNDDGFHVDLNNDEANYISIEEAIEKDIDKYLLGFDK